MDGILEHFAGRQHLLVQCLAEEAAAEALRGAHDAGCMTLLVEKEVTADRELTALSVRFVEESGEPVERLLLVREGRELADTDHQVFFDEFQALCKKAKLDWPKVLHGVSPGNTRRVGEYLLKRCRDHVCRSVLELWSSSLSINDQIALACYEYKEYPLFRNFFSTIDSLRELFSTQSWYELLKKSCPSAEKDTWASYEGTVYFVSSEGRKVKSVLETVQQLDPTKELHIESLINKLDDKFFSPCVVVFNALFKETKEISVKVKQCGNFDETDLSCFRLCLEDLSKERLRVLLIKNVKNIDREKSWETFHLLITHSVHIAAEVLQKCSSNFSEILAFVSDLPFVRNPSECKSRKRGGPRFKSELHQFSKAYPDLASLTAMIKALPRKEFRVKYPTLYSTLVKLLSLPLAPCDQRSLSQLKKGAAIAASCPPDWVGPIVVLTQSSGLLSSFIDKVDSIVDSLAEKFPDLAGEFTLL